MCNENKKDFDKEAAQWDANPGRVKLANQIADAIIREGLLDRSMNALDFGCGTGLVTLRIQPLVKSILGVDSSQGMLNILQEKIGALGMKNVRTQLVDFEKGGLVEGLFELIISSMTLHHITDTAALFRQLYGLLIPGGRLCIADLDKEDGSFHTDNTGVFHFGFARDYLRRLLQEAGFKDIHDVTAAKVQRVGEGEGISEFPVFLIITRK
jgi:tRNA (cmo5U34)-methyltransferase